MRILLVILLAGCDASPSMPMTDTTRVGFLYVGGIGDYGWTKSHEDGRLYLENFGANLRTRFVDNVTPDNAPAQIDALVAAENLILFATSYEFVQHTLEAPRRHPRLTALNCSGFKTGERAGSYMARMEEAEYLTGMVAGAMTRSNKIGVVAALRIYEQMMHINAFTLGARAVNPSAQVLVRWTGWWTDAAREEIAVEELAQAGADVIKGKTDSNRAVQVADRLGLFSIGHDNKDYCAVAPATCLISSYYNWGPLYLKLVDEIRRGIYPVSGRNDYVSSADLDVVGISPFTGAVPEEVQDQVLARRRTILDRTFHVFQGPFNYDDGQPWVAAGGRLSDEELICTRRFVEGVVDFPGPACSGDCGEHMSCVAGKCVAPDLSGC